MGSVARLGEIATIVGGGTPRRSNPAYFTDGTIPWATPSDITALDDLQISETKERITENALRESSARLLPAGAVLLTSRATIGFTAIAAHPMATNQGFANFICGDGVVPSYLALWLRSRRRLLGDMAGGTTFKEITKSTLRTIEIKLPDTQRQRDVSTILENMIALRKAHKRAMNVAEELLDVTMERLL